MAKRKKKKSVEEVAEDGNVILFTALSMILLAFFIVLNSLAVIDQNKKLEALGSLLGSFGLLPSGVMLEKGEVLLPYESPITEATDSFDSVMFKMERFILDYQITNEVAFVHDGRNLRMSISSDLLFLKDSDRLNPKTLSLLNLVARLGGSIDNKIRVEGHLGREEHLPAGVDAMEFSLLRGIRVMGYLMRTGKLEPNRFSVGGYGYEKPMDTGAINLKRKDGRVDITLEGQIRIRSEEEENKFRYKGFLFDFNRGLYGGR